MLITAKTVHIKNFRGFRDHRVTLSPTTVLVGQNNAGKSTFIDGLRILAIAVRKAKTARYGPSPDWLSGTAVGFGYKIGFETIDFDFSNIQYNHNRDEPATLALTYSNGVIVKVWLGNSPQESFCQVLGGTGEAASNGTTQAALEITPIYVMPPVQALVSHEKRISKARIEEFMYGRLASRHFRNQLFEKVPEYRNWKKLLTDTWPTVAVNAFDHNVGDSGAEFSLILREVHLPPRPLGLAVASKRGCKFCGFYAERRN